MRLFLGALSLLSLTLISQAAVAAEREERRDCDLIREWVATHLGDLPRSYEEINRYPLPYRRAIFNALSPDEQSMLWRNQLEQYAQSETALSEAQRGLLQEAIDLLGQGLFAPGDRRRSLARRLADFGLRAEQEFDHAMLGRLFGRLGPADVDIVVLNPAKLVASTPCTCNHIEDFCGSSYDCNGNAVCDQASRGCGWFWSTQCDGICQSDNTAQ